MGIPHLSEKPILFIGTLFSEEAVLDAVLPVLINQFGDIMFRSRTFQWKYSSHYDKELGTPIFRNYIFFDSVIDPSTLADIKLLTNETESFFSKDKKRRINIDPGYLTLAKVVLASTKNYSHRIYIGKGIYGELALYHKNGIFNPLPYTYNDYRDALFLDILTTVRNLLLRKTRLNNA